MTAKTVHPLFKNLQVGDRFWFNQRYGGSFWVICVSIKRKYAQLAKDGYPDLLYRFDMETGVCPEWSGSLWRSPEEEQESIKLERDRRDLWHLLQSRVWSLNKEQVEGIAAIAQINLEDLQQ